MSEDRSNTGTTSTTNLQNILPVDRNPSSTSSDMQQQQQQQQQHSLRIEFLNEHRVGVNVHDYYEEVKVLGVGAFSKIILVKKKKLHSTIHNKSTTNNTTLQEKNSVFLDNKTTTKKKSTTSFLWNVLTCPCLIVDETHYVLDRPQQPSTKEPIIIQYFALKKIDTSRVDIQYMEDLRNEIAIFKSLDHPNILKAYETFERKRELSVIMEFVTGGDLYTRRPYTDLQMIRRILKQILSAVTYMHHRNIMHRDLKFENILFENKKTNAEIKIIDFGLSTKFLNPNFIMRDKVGTLTTVAPDVIRGSYNIKADIWSIGVIAYMLFTGRDDLCPGKSKEEIERKILNFRWIEFEKKDSSLVNVSLEAKVFLKGLLQHNPTKRFTAEEAFNHTYLQTTTTTTNIITTNQNIISTSTHLLLNKPTESVRTAILDYANSSDLKKLALQMIAYQTHTEQTMILRRAFSIVDVDKSGEISYDDFKYAFRQSEILSELDIQQLFDKVDFKKEKHIDYTEFIAATIESQGRIEESRIAEAFERLDPENSGKISKETLRDILSNSESDEYISSLLKEADFDGDGMVNYDDFRRLFVEKKKDEIRKSLAHMD